MIYDRDIREPLYDYLEMKYGRIRILEEKRTGHSRADMVMITDSMIFGIEIKSDADTYARLSRQVEDYDLYYNRNYCVVGSTHGNHITEHVPPHWGIITVEPTEDGSLDFYELRAPANNPNCDMLHQFSLLWRPEMAHLQETLALPKYAYLSKTALCKKITERVPADILSPLICDELFERDYTKIAETINQYRTANGHKPRRKRKYKKRASVKI